MNEPRRFSTDQMEGTTCFTNDESLSEHQIAHHLLRREGVETIRMRGCSSSRCVANGWVRASYTNQYSHTRASSRSLRKEFDYQHTKLATPSTFQPDSGDYIPPHLLG
jgi:hypothetical protein